MAVYEGSRYRRGALVVRVPNPKTGLTAPAIYQNPSWLSLGDVSYRLYTVKDYDRLDKIAYVVYGSSELWWAIARLNPELLYVDSIPAGTVIRLPV